MKVFNHALRWFVGIFFIFSGTVKAIDPIGTAIKMGEYFTVFTEYMPALEGFFNFCNSLALPISIGMIILEIIMGISLLLGTFQGLTMFSIFALVVFFTFLTGFTVVTDKVTDCGCFGDFLKLKPIETFSKDVILTVLLIIMWIFRKYWTNMKGRQFGAFMSVVGITTLLVTFLSGYGYAGKINILAVMLGSGLIYGIIHSRGIGKGVAVAALAVLSIVGSAFTFRNYFNLPIVDFRAYKAGTNMLECTQPGDPGETIVKFIVEKDGKDETIGMNDFAQYTKDGWKYKERIDEVIREAELPDCKDFLVVTDDGTEIQDDILNHKGYSFWVSSHDVDKSSKEGFTRINEFLRKIEDPNVKKLGLTATPIDKANVMTEGIYDFYNLDAVPIKTMNRSNPGITFLKDGVIVAKFHHNHLPSMQELAEEYKYSKQQATR